jgi:small subunit ribosomal protein S16
MAVVIRMKRMGRKNRPSYRICAMDRRRARDGRTLETLGIYDPASTKPELELALDTERTKVWLERGALPSETVVSILRRQGIVLPVRKKRKERSRYRKTAARAHRAERKKTLGERKATRRTERLAARKAAKKAAAPAEAPA